MLLRHIFCCYICFPIRYSNAGAVYKFYPLSVLSPAPASALTNPGRFCPIPVRSGRFGLGLFGPILRVNRFGPISMVGHFGPIKGVIRFTLIFFYLGLRRIRGCGGCGGRGGGAAGRIGKRLSFALIKLIKVLLCI